MGGPFDGPEDLNFLERCISRSVPGSMIPVMYSNTYQILQTPGMGATASLKRFDHGPESLEAALSSTSNKLITWSNSPDACVILAGSSRELC